MRPPRRDHIEKHFGVALDREPCEVKGRLLPSPVIEYAQPGHYYAGTTGAWNMVDVRRRSRKCPKCASEMPPIMPGCACTGVREARPGLCRHHRRLENGRRAPPLTTFWRMPDVCMLKHG